MKTEGRLRVARFRSIAALVVAILMFCALPAQTETVLGEGLVRVLPGGAVIEVSGPLIGAMGEQLRAALREAPEAKLVRLNSAGGIIATALEIQTAILARGMATEVRHVCNSACTIAFLGGKQRTAVRGARFGFHRASAADASFNSADLMVRGLYLHAGVTEDFVHRALAAPHETMWFPPITAMLKAGFVSGIIARETP